MNKSGRKNTKKLWFAAAVAVIAFASAVAVRTLAGPVKTGGTYQILDDSLTNGGSTGVTGSSYWLVFAAGQPVGHEDMTGGTYSLEGGYVSGITAVYHVTKTVSQVETPVGYTGTVNVDKVPGGRLTYKLDFTNYGEAAKNTLIEDVVGSDMTYASSTIQLVLNNTPSAMTDGLDGDECGYMSATSSVHCILPDVAAGATGALIFKTIIN